LKWRILCVGGDRKSGYAPLIADYLARLQRTRPVSLEVVAESAGDDARARATEAEALRRRLREREVVVALDESGLELPSKGLAERLAKAEHTGNAALCFLIGGASGLDPSLKGDADWLLSLSRLTLPHLLARLVLVEQLYRAETILRGEPYSK
jgi:23S rRNA (pseudouridine1915-N3)-methyltransferase